MAPLSPEKGSHEIQTQTVEHAAVMQPGKVAGLDLFMEEFNKISETAKGGAGEQWSGTTGGSSPTPATQGGQQGGQSARDIAIANLPIPALMQKELEKHIRAEVKELRKQAVTITRLSQPGSAYHVNQLYSRIRHLNALLAQIFEASVDVVKRLFIRVFVDKQPIQ